MFYNKHMYNPESLKLGERKMKKIISLAMICLIVASTFAVFTSQVKSTDMGSWVSKTNMLQTRKDMAAVTYNGKIYAIGGSDRSGGGTERPTSVVEIYDPATDSWTTGTPMPVLEMHPSAVLLDDKIYVLLKNSRLFSYDPQTDTWTEHTSLPADANFPGIPVGVVDGKMYAARGYFHSTDPHWTYYYDPQTDTWTEKTAIPYHHNFDSFASLESKLYAIGGSDPSEGSRIETTRISVYNPATDTWDLDSVPRMSVHRGHQPSVTAVLNEKIYVMGGWNGYSAQSSLEEYDPVSNSWRTMASMPTARYSLATAVVNGKIYAVGGGAGGAGQFIYSVNEEFTPPGWPPSEVIPLPAGAWYADPNLPDGGMIDSIDSARLDRIDLNPSIIQDQQQIVVSPGETVTVDYSAWLMGNPGEIRQLWFSYSWASSYPPWDAYTGVFDGHPSGSGTVVSGTFDITAPSTPGTYKIWLCVQSRYGMIDALNQETVQPAMLPHAMIIVGGPEVLDPWEFCPYVYLDNGYGFPWDTTPDPPVNVLYTGTYFWGDLRVIQYWFHWNFDYKWWPLGFLESAIDYTKGQGWANPLRQPEMIGGAGWDDWEPIIVIVDDEGSIDYVLWRWHYNWLKFDLTIAGAELFHPTYDETHIKLWWAIGSHTPLTKYFAVDIPILLDIASWLRTPEQFKTAIGQYGDFTKPPIYELHDQGITYPCGMQEWDEDLALDMGFDPSDLKYVNNPTIAYSELQPWKLFDDFLSVILGSSANILVTAPNGLRVGYDSVTQTVVNEIEGATYSGPGTDPQVVHIPSPLLGIYNIDIVGTDSGVYTITIWSMAEDGSLAGFETHVGETVEGAEYAYSVSITDEAMTTNPNPATELGHLKDLINGLPDDAFDQSIRRATNLRKALFNKIDEVILKVEVGNYTDAVNKLFYDIRAKMDGDSTAEDWIIDPETQSDLCVIIDHIISGIETLKQG